LSGTENTVGADNPFFKIGQMHRTSLAFANASSPAIKFSHHRLDFLSFGDTVAMPPMGCGNEIAIGQLRQHPHRDRFLANG